MTTATAAAPELRRARLGLGAAAAVVTLVAGVIGAWSGSYPYADFGWGIVALGGGLVALVVLTALIVVCAISRRFSLGLLAAVVALLISAVAVRLDLPLQLRFALARSGFEQAIVDRGEAGPSAPCPDRIGSYRILSCSTEGSDTHFVTPGGFLDTVGFAYLPEGEPVDQSRRTYSPIDGPWFVFSEDW